jgi:NADH-quinone oxidoreductase subunit L
MPMLWLIPAIPLGGFLINGLFGRKLPKMVVSSVAIGASLLSFLWSMYVLRMLQPLDTPHIEHYFTWIQSGEFRVGADFAVDKLTDIMLMVITGVGTLIHIYSAGYMEHDSGYARFFAYLNLFMFFMLTLVLAQNFLVLFVGWEGVGLASYLLIGFWFDRKSATDAGNKAFIVNRIGDFGFSLAIFLTVVTFGSLDFTTVFNAAAGKQQGVLTAIALLLLVGACGKSAQLPLYVWLPDAMEGPTPVSALIHAATMVTAGVYMIARSSVIFVHSGVALDVVAIIGVLTAAFAAIIGLAQTDIKKVFAYSTVSQLGYMFIGLGCGAFSAGIFHLLTHAFFKAVLFLGAGAVIHACGGEQDMRRMGGLRKKMPITFWCLVSATFAISGIWPFAGFYSKDDILLAALHHAPWIYVVGLITALLTAFYVTRAMILTFFGTYKGEAHPHEAPMSMTLPLVVLGFLSFAGGFLFDVPRYLSQFFPVSEAYGENPLLQIVAVAVGAVGILLAVAFYLVRPGIPDALARGLGGFYTLVYNKFFVDEIYDATVVQPTLVGSRNILMRGVDRGLLDGSVSGTAQTIRGAGEAFRHLQSGNIRSYATWVVLGSVFVLIMLGLGIATANGVVVR